MTTPDPDTDNTAPSFADLQIHPLVLQAGNDRGYESPSAIQAATIPAMMAGSDVVGLAQTGTGKTAAFAIPILSKIDTSSRVTPAPAPCADPRVGSAGRRGLQPLRRAFARQCAADLRRLPVRPADGRPQAWRPGRRRHSGPGHRPPREAH